MLEISEEILRGYAGTQSARCWQAFPKSADDCRELLKWSGERHLTICGRGSGYSYADMILNGNHVVANFTRMNRIFDFNPILGTIRVEPGVRFSEIFERSLEKGWSLSSCPGGMWVTIGGAIANNVHGKDSFAVGNFGEQILELRLMLADGTEQTLSPTNHKELFEGVIGGAGLLGLIIEVTLQLRPVPSAFVEQVTVPTKNLEETLKAVDEGTATQDFVVAWIDAFAKGPNLGRGFVTSAKWIKAPRELRSKEISESLVMPTRIFNLIPAKPFWFLARPLFMPFALKWINALNYFRARWAGEQRRKLLFTDYNFMHNKIPGMNTVYEPQGFLEFQPLIPRRLGVQGVRDVIELCQAHNSESLLCGLKLHRSDEFALSYSGDGYSFGIDIQLRGRDPKDVDRFTKSLFELTEKQGGTVYLAKDEKLTRENLKAMYPKLPHFLRLKQKWDPQGRFSSDMWRRFGLDGAARIEGKSCESPGAELGYSPSH